MKVHPSEQRNEFQGLALPAPDEYKQLRDIPGAVLFTEKFQAGICPERKQIQSNHYDPTEWDGSIDKHSMIDPYG